ncbi:MAG: hypothetical protein Q8L48_06175 [Archangium sp.]|nr:hypothetical protein [Archangium sp.]
MKLPLSLCALVVIAASCQCGGPLDPCEATKCGTGLECAPSTGKCVSASSDSGVGGGAGGGSGTVGGGGGSTDGGGADAGACPAACSGATPICDAVAQRCVVCASSSDCPLTAPICVTTVQPAGACYQCRNLLDCPNAADCDPVTHLCLAPPDAGTGGGGGNEPVVYGHTASTLYKVNATTKAVTPVASFGNCDGEVIDLALDQYSRAFVTTQSGLFQLNLTTAQCSAVNPSTTESYPNSLSFVPKGTIDPNYEVLVGYAGSSYVRINLSTGALQQIGTLGGGFVSSGDIVSVIDGGTYLTAKDPGGPSTSDYLIEVNPTTGALVRSFGTLPFNDVYGLAFWGGSLYGFSNGGTLFEITITGSTTTSVPVPNAASQQWNGAGSTTAAKLR